MAILVTYQTYKSDMGLCPNTQRGNEEVLSLISAILDAAIKQGIWN
tara:strand:+ start:183 stop:320 length:138 start_codon:yes stop_codon:yes gene_type:complete